MRIATLCALAGCTVGADLPFAGPRVRSGCLDVSCARVHDTSAPDPVIAFSLDNKCWREARVDFAAIRVRATRIDGTSVALAAYDPLHELRLRSIEPFAGGNQRIAYVAGPDVDLTRPICVDVTRLDARARGSADWTCLAAPDAREPK